MAEKIQGDSDMGDGSGNGWIGGCAASLALVIVKAAALCGLAYMLKEVARWVL